MIYFAVFISDLCREKKLLITDIFTMSILASLKFLQALLFTCTNCVYQFVRKGQSVSNTAFDILYTAAKNPVTG